MFLSALHKGKFTVVLWPKRAVVVTVRNIRRQYALPSSVPRRQLTTKTDNKQGVDTAGKIRSKPIFTEETGAEKSKLKNNFPEAQQPLTADGQTTNNPIHGRSTEASKDISTNKSTPTAQRDPHDLSKSKGTDPKFSTGSRQTSLTATADVVQEKVNNIHNFVVDGARVAGENAAVVAASTTSFLQNSSQRVFKGIERTSQLLADTRSTLSTINFKDRKWSESLTDVSQILVNLSFKTTGYDSILLLKQNVENADKAFQAARVAYKNAQTSYEAVIKKRTDCQLDANRLLQQQSSWQAEDVARYGELLKADHLLRQEVAQAERIAAQSEEDVQVKLAEYTTAMRERYHQEQIWSDSIRGLSTYGTLIVMGFNLLMLFLSIVAFEPRRRKKIVQGVQSSIEQQQQQTEQLVQSETKALGQRLQDQLSNSAVMMANSAGQPPMSAEAVQLDQSVGAAGPSDKEKDVMALLDTLVDASRAAVDESRATLDQALKANQQTAVMAAGTGFAVGGAVAFLAVWLSSK